MPPCGHTHHELGFSVGFPHRLERPEVRPQRIPGSHRRHGGLLRHLDSSLTSTSDPRPLYLIEDPPVPISGIAEHAAHPSELDRLARLNRLPRQILAARPEMTGHRPVDNLPRSRRQIVKMLQVLLVLDSVDGRLHRHATHRRSLHVLTHLDTQDLRVDPGGTHDVANHKPRGSDRLCLPIVQQRLVSLRPVGHCAGAVEFRSGQRCRSEQVSGLLHVDRRIALQPRPRQLVRQRLVVRMLKALHGAFLVECPQRILLAVHRRDATAKLR